MLALQPGILLAAVLWSRVAQADSFGLLFTDSLGHKMLTQAGIYLALNVVLLIVGCWLLNRFFAEQHKLRYALSLVLHIGCFVFLFMPAVWVVVVGPAALNIMRSLAL